MFICPTAPRAGRSMLHVIRLIVKAGHTVHAIPCSPKEAVLNRSHLSQTFQRGDWKTQIPPNSFHSCWIAEYEDISCILLQPSLVQLLWMDVPSFSIYSSRLPYHTWCSTEHYEQAGGWPGSATKVRSQLTFSPSPHLPECLQEPPPMGKPALGVMGFIHTRDCMGDFCTHKQLQLCEEIYLCMSHLWYSLTIDAS